MASRDLTSAFMDRRNAANVRRRDAGGSTGSRLKPFGEIHLIINDHSLVLSNSRIVFEINEIIFSC